MSLALFPALFQGRVTVYNSKCCRGSRLNVYLWVWFYVLSLIRSSYVGALYQS